MSSEARENLNGYWAITAEPRLMTTAILAFPLTGEDDEDFTDMISAFDELLETMDAHVSSTYESEAQVLVSITYPSDREDSFTNCVHTFFFKMGQPYPLEEPQGRKLN